MAINPWGTILAQAADGVSNITVDINRNTINKIRDNFPVLKHRRSDIFGI
jgi:predicted amidohydrolase